MFDAIPHGEIFATGYVVDPRLYSDPDMKAAGLPTWLRWVAKKGDGNDWALYYGKKNWSIGTICVDGDKSFTPSVIRELVYCTDEVYEKYRH